jgi:hypothetical protein
MWPLTNMAARSAAGGLEMPSAVYLLDVQQPGRRISEVLELVRPVISSAQNTKVGRPLQLYVILLVMSRCGLQIVARTCMQRRINEVLERPVGSEQNTKVGRWLAGSTVCVVLSLVLVICRLRKIANTWDQWRISVMS